MPDLLSKYQRQEGRRKMAFNLENYDEVKDRIPLFYEQFPDGRITTEIISEDSTGVTIKAYLWKNAEEQVMNAPLATGLAREFPGGRIDKYTENCETSSLGRAIANFNLIGEKGKKNRTFPSREEMESAQGLIDMKQSKENRPASSPSAPVPAKKINPITDKQIHRLQNRHNYDGDLSNFTSAEASALIDQLTQKEEAAEKLV